MKKALIFDIERGSFVNGGDKNDSVLFFSNIAMSNIYYLLSNLYFNGEIPLFFLNAWLNVYTSQNPHWSAISDIFLEVFSNKISALFMRSCCK